MKIIARLLITTALAALGSVVACSRSTLLSGDAGPNACPAGLALCGKSCVDLSSDNANCGACGNTCANASCDDGACEECEPDSTLCDGVCARLDTDNSNCGACGNTCVGEQVCSNGTCGDEPSCADPICGVCDVIALDSAASVTVSGTPVGDVLTPSCGDPGSGEQVFSFTPPFDGVYRFDTIGSNYDTVLYVLGSNCEEVICDDDNSGVTSLLETLLVGGQTVYPVVDGYNGNVGTYVLNITLQ